VRLIDDRAHTLCNPTSITVVLCYLLITIQPNYPSPLPHPGHDFIFIPSLQKGGEQCPEVQGQACAHKLNARRGASVRDRYSTARRPGSPGSSRRRNTRRLGRVGDRATRSGPVRVGSRSRRRSWSWSWSRSRAHSRVVGEELGAAKTRTRAGIDDAVLAACRAAAVGAAGVAGCVVDAQRWLAGEVVVASVS